MFVDDLIYFIFGRFVWIKQKEVIYIRRLLAYISFSYSESNSLESGQEYTGEVLLGGSFNYRSLLLSFTSNCSKHSNAFTSMVVALLVVLDFGFF